MGTTGWLPRSGTGSTFEEFSEEADGLAALEGGGQRL
jgi:hypothetical protein